MQIDATTIILALISAVVAPLVVIVGRALSRKLGLEIETTRLVLVSELAAGAVAYAEQLRVNARAEGVTMSSAEILNAAVKWFTEQSRSHGLDRYALDYAERLIEAKVGERNELRRQIRASQRPPQLASEGAPATDDRDTSPAKRTPSVRP